MQRRVSSITQKLCNEDPALTKALNLKGSTTLIIRRIKKLSESGLNRLKDDRIFIDKVHNPVFLKILIQTTIAVHGFK